MIKFNEQLFDIFEPVITKDSYLQEIVTYSETADRTSYLSVFKQNIEYLDEVNPRYQEISFIGLTDDLSIGIGCKVSNTNGSYIVVDSIAIGFKNKLYLKPCG